MVARRDRRSARLRRCPTRIPDGVNTVTLRVTDSSGVSATDTVQITVLAPARPPTANAGADQNVADTDGQLGELVTLTGTGTDPDGTIASYQWLNGTTVLGTSATLPVRLPDGVSTLTLVVTDNSGLTANDTVQVTIAAPVLPIVNVGVARTIEDTDVQAGETVQLTGSATGTIARYRMVPRQQLARFGFEHLRATAGWRQSRHAARDEHQQSGGLGDRANHSGYARAHRARENSRTDAERVASRTETRRGLQQRSRSDRR